MNISDLKLLLDYNYWANHRILIFARLLDDVQLNAPMPKGFSAGSLHATLRHTLFAEWLWLRRCRDGNANFNSFDNDAVATLTQLEALWADEEKNMRDWLATLSDADTEKTIRYARSDGTPLSNALWHILQHVVLHGMQHRGECAAMLTDFGHSPGNIDMIMYLRERN